MKQVIWVVGTSSSGKQTFLKNVLADKKLQEQLGLANQKITLLERSIIYPGDATMPTVVRERGLIPQDAIQLLGGDSEVVLIKWQYVDSQYMLPAKLESGILNARHSVIVLEASEADSLQRLELKDWWRTKGFNNSKELYDFEQKQIKKYISELSKSYDLIRLDSSDGAAYRQIV